MTADVKLVADVNLHYTWNLENGDVNVSIAQDRATIKLGIDTLMFCCCDRDGDSYYIKHVLGELRHGVIRREAKVTDMIAFAAFT